MEELRGCTGITATYLPNVDEILRLWSDLVHLSLILWPLLDIYSIALFAQRNDGGAQTSIQGQETSHATILLGWCRPRHLRECPVMSLMQRKDATDQEDRTC